MGSGLFIPWPGWFLANMKKLVDFVLVLILVAAVGYMVYLARNDGSLFGTPTPTMTSTAAPSLRPSRTPTPSITSTPARTSTPTATPTQTSSPSPTAKPTQEFLPNDPWATQVAHHAIAS